MTPYNPQFAPRVREIRPTEAVREVMRQHGWSWQIVECQTRLALQACEEGDYPMTEFAIPITQVQFYTWPIGDFDEIVRLDLSMSRRGSAPTSTHSSGHSRMLPFGR